MKRKRVSISKFNDDINLDEANEFIKKWEKLGVYIALDEAKIRFRFNDRSHFVSAGLEALYLSFITIKKKFPDHFENEKLCKFIIRKTVKRTIYDMSVIVGYIPSSGQIYFPKKWVSWDDYFKETTCNNTIVQDLDFHLIEEFINEMPVKKREIIQLFLAGYNFQEIASRLNYANKSSPLKMFGRLTEEIKQKLNVQ